MKNIFKQAVIVLLVVSMAVMSVGCYGSFALTKKVYDWNGSMGNKWVVELVFLVATAVPVYGIAAFVDLYVLNLLEFWTGKNPMASNITTDDGTTVAFNEATQQATLTYQGKQFVIGVVDGKPSIQNAQGETLAYIETDANGMMIMKDAQGNVIDQQSKAAFIASVQK